MPTEAEEEVAGAVTETGAHRARCAQCGPEGRLRAHGALVTPLRTRLLEALRLPKGTSDGTDVTGTAEQGQVTHTWVWGPQPTAERAQAGGTKGARLSWIPCPFGSPSEERGRERQRG